MRFTKMQGVGNDFVVIESALIPSQTDLSDLAIRLCQHHFGIGADGMLIVANTPHEDAAFAMRMFNPDGTEDMCGNGLRCVSLWAHRHGWLGDQKSFHVGTKEGPRSVKLLEVAEVGRSALVEAGMGVPRFLPNQLPFDAKYRSGIVDYPLQVDDREFNITTVNTGSTHTVIFVDSLDEETFQHYSPLIEVHPCFPDRTSIMWTTPAGKNQFNIRIWERGAGETWGCGTGACAVGVAAQLHQLSAPNQPVHVISKGGILTIRWPGERQNITMIGPAEMIFEGTIESSFLV